MKKAAIVVSDYYNNNRLFNMNDTIANKDNCLYFFYKLKNELATRNVGLCTHDINRVNESDIVIFNDMPHKLPLKQLGQKYYLLALESIAVHPINFDQSRYVCFDKIFTWKDDIIDGKKVIKINYSYLIDPDFDLDLACKQKLACLVANNKCSAHELELYSSRVDAINWFEKKHPDDLDLYGCGWNQLPPANLVAKMINRMKLARLFSTKHDNCYKGIASPKIPILKKYKFNICYENVRDIPGYITEKIFDCFFAGCVPIYWGANNVTDHIPKGCFIDKREFKTYEDLYSYMKNMSDTEYLSYLECIDAFLKSERGYKFSADCFAETITREIVGG